MRTPLVLLVGSLVVGCTVGDPDTGGGDEGGEDCGNGVVDTGEECDGGASCTASCTLVPSPELSMVADKVTISTELRSSNMVTVTLVGSKGFGGNVTLAGSVVDANNVAIPGWAVALNRSTVNVPTDGSTDVVATLTIPSENDAANAASITGTLKIEATSTLGKKSTTTQITALNQVSLNVTMAGGLCDYSAVMGATRIAVGTKVRMVNKGTANMIFHSDGNAAGVPHQDTTTTTPVNMAYEKTVTTAGGAFNWYCHTPGPNPGAAVQIVPVAVAVP